MALALVENLLTRTELPQDGARLNPAHPLAGRFVTAYLPGVSSDNLGFGGPGGIVGHAHSRSAIPAGPTLRLSGSGANATTDRSYGPTPSYPLTMVVVCRQGSSTNGVIVGIAASSAIGGSYWYIGGGSTSQVLLLARNNFGSTIALLATVPIDANGRQAVGQDLVIVAQSLSASDHRLCVNGSAIATTATNIGSLVAWDRLYFGQASGTTDLDVAAVLFAHGGRALTDAQMRQISRSPREVWGLFEPQLIWAPVAAGGGSSWSVNLSEPASAADALTAAATAVVSLLEGATASDILSAATTAAVALSEAASAADAVTETYSSPGAAAVAEAASAADALTAAAVLLRAIAEAGSSSDALTAATTMVRALSEPAVAADAVTGALPGSWSVSIAEIAAAVDALAGVVAGDELVRSPEEIVLAARARLTSLTLAHPQRRIGNILKG